MNWIIRTFLTCTFTVFTLFSLSAQEEQPVDTTLTLAERYTQLLRQSENYKEYEVVRKSSLNLFWAALNDSVTTANASLKQALVEKMELQNKLSKAESDLSSVQTQLAATQEQDNSAKLLGISMSATGFNVTFIVVVVLLSGIALFYVQRYKSGSSTVKDTVKEHEALQASYDELRHKSKETQMKLKRELQTALNRLEAVDNRP